MKPTFPEYLSCDPTAGQGRDPLAALGCSLRSMSTQEREANLFNGLVFRKKELCVKFRSTQPAAVSQVKIIEVKVTKRSPHVSGRFDRLFFSRRTSL